MNQNFDIAIANLSRDLDDAKLSAKQVVHTAECIALAYGPNALDVLAVAMSDTLTHRWEAQRQ